MELKEIKQLSVNKVKDKLANELASKFSTAGKAPP
jgi:hypothetical protein